MDQALKEKYLEPGQANLRKPRILVAPLDWGLGHATRCIPIINELLLQNCDVLIAGEGIQQKLLHLEFPQLTFLHLDGYRVKYSRSAVGLLFGMLRQTPRILHAIKKENEWVRQLLMDYAPDAIISDNRFGLYHPSLPCTFMTHQLTIKSPLGKWSEKILQKRNYHYINQFSECWIPDEAGNNNLAGELSHPGTAPTIPVNYLGTISRFVQKDIPEKNGHLSVILSGPEPQRTVLEEKIIREISHYPGTATVLRGLPGAESIMPSTNMLRFYNHLPLEELNLVIQEAEFVICRSGYSTIMDLIGLGKKTIMIPTPGQSEQEYLAAYLFKNKLAFCVEQKSFSLEAALKTARQFPYRKFKGSNGNLLSQTISRFITRLSIK